MEFTPLGNKSVQLAVETLAKTLILLANGITGKTPEDLDFDAVLEYIGYLKDETEKIQRGNYAKDNSMYYVTGGDITFDKSPRTR